MEESKSVGFTGSRTIFVGPNVTVESTVGAESNAACELVFFDITVEVFSDFLEQEKEESKIMKKHHIFVPVTLIASFYKYTEGVSAYPTFPKESHSLGRMEK